MSHSHALVVGLQAASYQHTKEAAALLRQGLRGLRGVSAPGYGTTIDVAKLRSLGMRANKGIEIPEKLVNQIGMRARRVREALELPADYDGLHKLRTALEAASGSKAIDAFRRPGGYLYEPINSSTIKTRGATFGRFTDGSDTYEGTLRPGLWTPSQAADIATSYDVPALSRTWWQKLTGTHPQSLPDQIAVYGGPDRSLMRFDPATGAYSLNPKRVADYMRTKGSSAPAPVPTFAQPMPDKPSIMENIMTLGDAGASHAATRATMDKLKLRNEGHSLNLVAGHGGPAANAFRRDPSPLGQWVRGQAGGIRKELTQAVSQNLPASFWTESLQTKVPRLEAELAATGNKDMIPSVTTSYRHLLNKGLAATQGRPKGASLFPKLEESATLSVGLKYAFLKDTPSSTSLRLSPHGLAYGWSNPSAEYRFGKLTELGTGQSLPSDLGNALNEMRLVRPTASPTFQRMLNQPMPESPSFLENLVTGGDAGKSHAAMNAAVSNLRHRNALAQKELLSFAPKLMNHEASPLSFDDKLLALMSL